MLQRIFYFYCKPGPAAGDAEIRNATLVDTLFGNHESRHSTVSGSRATNQRLSSRLTSTLQHHHSMQLERVHARLFDYPQSSRAMSDIQMTPLQVSVQTSINVHENSSTYSNTGQDNNNMFSEISPRRVRFSEMNHRPSTQYMCTIDEDNVCSNFRPVYSPVSEASRNNNSRRQLEYRYPISRVNDNLPRSVDYRKGRTLCLSLSITVFILILIELSFLLSCLHFKYSCAYVSGFICRTGLLSITILVIEVLKSFVEKSNSSKNELSGPPPTNYVPVQIPLLTSSLTPRFLSRYPFTIHPEALRAQTMVPMLTEMPLSYNRVANMPCIDGKQLALCSLLVVLDLVLIVVLLTAGIDLSARLSLSSGSASVRNISSTNSSYNFGLSVCHHSDIEAGLVYLVIHGFFLCFRCITGFVNGCGICFKQIASKRRLLLSNPPEFLAMTPMQLDPSISPNESKHPRQLVRRYPNRGARGSQPTCFCHYK